MIIILIIWTIGIFAVSHYIKHRRYHKSDVKFFRIYSGVHDLAQIVNQDADDAENEAAAAVLEYLTNDNAKSVYETHLFDIDVE